MPRSLQGRMLALVLTLVAAVWVFTAVTLWMDTRHELDELLDSHLAQAAALLVLDEAGEVEEEHVRDDAPTLHRYATRVAFQVFRSGRLVVRSANAPGRPMLDRFANGFRTVAIGDTSWRVFGTQDARREVQVFVGEQVASRAAILRAILASALWPLAAALPLLGAASWWAVRRGTAPMRRLGDALAARNPQALEPVEVRDAPSEMVPMVGALNGLFARMRTLLETERRFTSDAAHELRTPIAAIRTQA
ncbi:MAG TPA: sensor histidine kinase N-terminal domain-containing protein, partial [Usitatibacter sp.]|nr:sensor histidine kinase N-terminal domain-containing protein [Usitatibacter sp.]